MATRRRMDGFSEDGLSYAVSDDFSKMLGQAMAEQEARLNDPRFVAGARVEQPDAPDILQRELIDPVLTAFGLDTGRRVADSRASRAPATRLFEMGNELISADPATGRTQVIHRQQKPQAEMTPRQKMEYADLLARRRALQGGVAGSQLNAAEIAALDERINNFFGSAAPPVPDMGPTAPPDLLGQPGSGFIGDMDQRGEPTGSNRFIGRSPARSAAPQRGKTLTRELAEQFKQQARGDKELARRLAREAGYEF